MILYGYWRSSSAWRVRIGLALKGLDYTNVPVHLVKAEQRAPAHAARNPLRQVPVLELADGTQLTQSLAILEWLDETHPSPPLLPADALGRARCRAMAEVVNSGIQPLQNLAVLQGIDAIGGDRVVWGREAISRGLAALEAMANGGTPFLCGDAPTVADLLLVPQLYNARRFACDLSGLPTLLAVEARCAAMPVFQASHPDRQPDAQG
ncbi:MAG: maleylpyruvate isomerase [Myxococcota bacterium]|jgi:maleylpyruvate isomerase